MATTAAQKAREAELKKTYGELSALPADEGRKVAVQQQSSVVKRLGQYRDKLGGLFGRWKEFDDDVSDIAQQIAWGDELAPKTDDDSRKKRRKHYARAYIRGRTAAANLDKEIDDGSTFEVLVKDVITGVAKTTEKVVDKVVDTAEQAAEKLEKAVDDIGEGVSTGVWVGLAGLIAMGLLYAMEKGKQR